MYDLNLVIAESSWDIDYYRDGMRSGVDNSTLETGLKATWLYDSRIKLQVLVDTFSLTVF
jgi:hypothetical protein